MFKRLIAALVCITFSFTNLPFANAQLAAPFSVNQLPVPGTMIGESAPFVPLSLKGLVINPNKPLEFQFIVDTGKGPQDTVYIKKEANRLVKYFLAGLTIPEGELWVNLSPYEKNRITTPSLGQTLLGRDLLAQDYILKQLTASLIYPEKDLGKEFWSRVYAKAQQEFGTTNIPVNTFNKVWILPDQAQVYENGPAAYITQSTLKVMLDEDYLATHKHQGQPGDMALAVSPSRLPTSQGLDSKAPQGNPAARYQDVNSLGSQIIREIVIPEITKEVNTGKNFAPLRQIYNAMILAKWYKETIANGLLDALYTNKKRVGGINLTDPVVKEQIYQRYLQAYKKGVFNYIKDDATPDGQMVPRKYFSGGTLLAITNLKEDGTEQDVENEKPDGAMVVLTIGIAGVIVGTVAIGVGVLKNKKRQRIIENERILLKSKIKKMIEEKMLEADISAVITDKNIDLAESYFKESGNFAVGEIRVNTEDTDARGNVIPGRYKTISILVIGESKEAIEKQLAGYRKAVGRFPFISNENLPSAAMNVGRAPGVMEAREMPLNALHDPAVRNLFLQFLKRNYDFRNVSELFHLPQAPGEITYNGVKYSIDDYAKIILNFLLKRIDKDPFEVAEEFRGAFPNGAVPPELAPIIAAYTDIKTKVFDMEVLKDVLRKGTVVADIGAGKNSLGKAILEYSDGHNLGIKRVIGTDLNEWPDREKDNDSRLDFRVQKSATVLPIPPNSVDTVIVKWVFHHMSLEDQKDLLRSIHGILKPGGQVIIYEALMATPENRDILGDFEKEIQNPETWPEGSFRQGRLELTRNFLNLNLTQQRQINALEDYYGHNLIFGRNAYMPQFFTYLSVDQWRKKMGESGFVEDVEARRVYGVAPFMTLGPPSLRLVFTKPSPTQLTSPAQKPSAAMRTEKYDIIQGTMGDMKTKYLLSRTSNRVVIYLHGMGGDINNKVGQWLEELPVDMTTVRYTSSRFNPKPVTDKDKWVQHVYGDNSDKGAKVKTFNDEMEDLRRVIDHTIKQVEGIGIQRSQQEIILVGESLGGMIVPLIAREYPQVKGIVSIAGAMKPLSAKNHNQSKDKFHPITGHMPDEAEAGRMFNEFKGKTLIVQAKADFFKRNESSDQWRNHAGGEIEYAQIPGPHDINGSGDETRNVLKEILAKFILSFTNDLATSTPAQNPPSAAMMTKAQQARAGWLEAMRKKYRFGASAVGEEIEAHANQFGDFFNAKGRRTKGSRGQRMAHFDNVVLFNSGLWGSVFQVGNMTLGFYTRSLKNWVSIEMRGNPVRKRLNLPDNLMLDNDHLHGFYDERLKRLSLPKDVVSAIERARRDLDRATVAQGPGGIDLNKILLHRTGHVIQMQFDPAQLNSLEQGGFQGFTPVIINIQRISSPLPLLGINQPAKEPELLAKV